VRLSAWSHTPKRCSPVARDSTLIMGGRSFASVPCPWRVWARRLDGAVGSRGGVLVFPGVLVPFVRLKGGAGHHAGRCGSVHMGLDALPHGIELFA
jgi:hypothetical protein